VLKTILFGIMIILTVLWFILLIIKFVWFFGILEQDGESGFPI